MSMSKEKMDKELDIKAKDKAIKKRSGSKMHKTHHSAEYCSKCGEKVSTSTRHESGHRESDHFKEDERYSNLVKGM